MAATLVIHPGWQRATKFGRPWSAPSQQVMKRLRADSQPEDQQGEGSKGREGKARASSSGEESSPTIPPRRMATLRERYRLNDEDEGLLASTSAGASFAHSNLPDSAALVPLVAPSGIAASVAEETFDIAERRTATTMKRRRSRSASPSRPRSQKGSAESVIASARRLDEDLVSATRQHMESGAASEGASSSVAGPLRSPRKAARISETEETSAPARVTSPHKRGGSRLSESESTSPASSPRERPTGSRASSPARRIAPHARHEGEFRRSERSQEEAYYTWQSTHPTYESSRLPSLHRSGETEPAAGPSSIRRRLPPLQTDVERGSGPGSAPQISRYAAVPRSRSNSPSSRSRVLSHSTGHGDQSGRLYGELSRPAYEYYSQRSTKYEPQGRYEQYSRRRSMSYDLDSVSEGTTPRMAGPHVPGEGPSSAQAPGQAFIHPSLAGLPGAGGGAGSKQQPSFVSKLYSMLEDNTIVDMISWGPSGTTFSVANPAEFAKVVLPNWFKHSNWQSFVRQLNMYGFHKVNHTYQGTPDDEIQIWEFKHPNFRRGEVQLLGEIKRKSSRHKRQDSLTRGMVGVAEFEYSGSPSPEMGLSHMRLRGMTGPAHGPPHSAYTSVPAGMAAPQAGPSSQSAQSEARYASGAPATAYYREYPAGPSSASRAPYQGEMTRGGVSVPAHAGPGMSDSVTLRFEEVSERIDAVIRHAAFYEGEMRTMKEQIYALQQNEGSLRAHVHHLEAQMRTLSDQLNHQQQQQQPQQFAQSQPRLPPPPSYQQQPRIPSASPTLRTREQGHVPLAPPPPPSAGYTGRSPAQAHRGGYGMSSHRAQLSAGGMPMPSMQSPTMEQYQQRQQASSAPSSSIAGPQAGPGAPRHQPSSASMPKDEEI